MSLSFKLVLIVLMLLYSWLTWISGKQSFFLVESFNIPDVSRGTFCEKNCRELAS